MAEVGAASMPSLIEGDCLAVAPTLAGGTFDLIYADPPFFTKRDFVGAARGLRGNGKALESLAQEQADSARETLKFTDRWLSDVGNRNDRKQYLAWLEPRLLAMRRLLKPNGNFLLHLDWHAVHYAKVMCDEIFREENFQNELIWHYQTGGASKGRFSRKHDTILFYSNGPGFYFDGKSIAIPRTPKAMKRAQCATGARIKATDTHKNPDDVLIIPALNPMATERTGYPTQKPVELLTRLITALCPKGGLVGDFFCGSGTTLVAAKMLERRYFGCDVNAAAVALARKRVGEITSPAR
ncbi:MAG TPA: site-specific DNA-methyltransferase [Phycisphaerae bacterium]|nr:site-specific DNA-methyltransferase [Phycisphaerae bacterium]